MRERERERREREREREREEFSGYDDRGSCTAERWMSALHTPILNEKERFRPWKQG